MTNRLENGIGNFAASSLKPSKGILMSLANKVAIVTGGNSGIGKAIVLELAKNGASVVIDYVSHPDATEALEQEIVALGDRVIGVEASWLWAWRRAR
jgi:hypothetical protein